MSENHFLELICLLQTIYINENAVGGGGALCLQAVFAWLAWDKKRVCVCFDEMSSPVTGGPGSAGRPSGALPGRPRHCKKAGLAACILIHSDGCHLQIHRPLLGLVFDHDSLIGGLE